MGNKDTEQKESPTQNGSEYESRALEKQIPSDEEFEPTDMDIAVFQAVTDHYKQDIREFFVRNNLFVAVHAALLSTEFLKGIPNTFSEYVVTSVIFLAGLFFAYLWKRVIQSSIFWMSKWRNEVRFLSRKYSRFHSYDKIERFAHEHPKMCSEVIAKDLPRFVIVVWAALWLIFTIAFLVPNANAL